MTDRLVPSVYATIAAALAASAGTDRVLIGASGTYHEGDLVVPANISVEVDTDVDVVVDGTTPGATNIFLLNGGSFLSGSLGGFQIKGAAHEAVDGAAADRAYDIEDLLITNSRRGVAGLDTAGSMKRIVIRDIVNEGVLITGGKTPAMESLEVYDCGGAGIVAVGATIEHATVVDCAGTVSLDAGTTGTLRNCVSKDNNPTLSGARALTYDQVYSDGNAVNNFAGGGTPSGGFSVDPELEDVAARDLRPTATSPLVGAGSASTPTLDVQRRTFASPPTIGAHELPRILFITAEGTHSLWLRTSGPMGPPAKLRSGWALTGPANAPLVATATEQGSATEYRLKTDRLLEEGVSYTVTPVALTQTGESLLGLAFLGIPSTVQTFPNGVLLDLDFELFKGQRYRPDGDLALVGGTTSLRRMIEDIVLTVKGSLPWLPGHGSVLPHKGPVPSDLRSVEQSLRRQVEAMPRVIKAVFAASFDGELVLRYHAETNLGPLDGSV